MKTFSKILAYWLPLLILLSGVMLFAYIAVQQNYRQSLNDPQIELAEHAALTLANDYTPAAVVPRGTAPIDLATSLDTWISVYDLSGMSLESSGVLDGAPPKLPAGLFDTSTWVAHKTWQAPTGPETRVTWQPENGVRQAVVLVQFRNPSGSEPSAHAGYVAVGRSMRTTEDRIIDLTKLFALAWSVTALATLVAVGILVKLGWL